MKESVSRSRLYFDAYLPGAVNRFRSRALYRVSGVRNDDHALGRIDSEQLLDVTASMLRGWEAAGGQVEEGLREASTRSQLVVQSPSTIYTKAYPLLLRCTTCLSIDFFQDSDEDRTRKAIHRKIRSRVGHAHVPCKKPGCHGHMTQLPYVVVHRCGSLHNMRVKRSIQATSQLGFKDTGGSFAQNYYFDVSTGQRLSDDALQETCPGCKKLHPNLSGLAQRATPATAGNAFYPQNVQYIALSPDTGDLIGQLHRIAMANEYCSGLTGDIADAITGVLIGTFDSLSVAEQLKVSLSGGKGPIDLAADTAQLESLRKKIAKMEAIGDMEDAIKVIEEKIWEIEVRMGATSGAFAAVRDFVPAQETRLALARDRRSHEAAFLRFDVKRRTVKDELGSAESMMGGMPGDGWSTLVKRYGVAEISHISDLKVVLASIGYSRELRQPELNPDYPPVILNGYIDEDDPAMKGKRAVYAMSAETEALLLRLDPCRVLQWCVDSLGWEHPGTLALHDRTRAHAWLLDHSAALTMSPFTVQREADSMHPRDTAPFHLLHSIAHALMATIRQHSGYDDKTIQEYLLPSDLSVILFVSSVENYTAGGLVTLFRNYLLDWFDDASRYVFNCAFDPFCSELGGSCSGCLQRELRCETMNNGLSRNYLHGGVLGEMAVLKGFWS